MSEQIWIKEEACENDFLCSHFINEIVKNNVESFAENYVFCHA